MRQHPDSFGFHGSVEHSRKLYVSRPQQVHQHKILATSPKCQPGKDCAEACEERGAAGRHTDEASRWCSVRQTENDGKNMEDLRNRRCDVEELKRNRFRYIRTTREGWCDDCTDHHQGNQLEDGQDRDDLNKNKYDNNQKRQSGRHQQGQLQDITH